MSKVTESVSLSSAVQSLPTSAAGSFSPESDVQSELMGVRKLEGEM